MLTSFEARGYRNLDTKLSLGRVNVLIGPNNCGKSNLMRAIRFASDAARLDAGGSWNDVVRQHGGQDIVSWSFEKPWFISDARIQLAWWFDEDHLELCLSPNAADVPVRRTERFFYRANGVPFRFEVTEDGWTHLRGDQVTDKGVSTSSFLSSAVHFYNAGQLPGRDYEVRQEALDTWHFRAGDVDIHEVSRLTRGAHTDTRLRHDASNFANHLRHLESNHADGLTAVTEAMRELIPGTKRIWLRDAEGLGLWVELNIKGRAIKLRDLSDGSVMALLLASLLFGPEVKSMLMLDEPELNLHPAWLRVVGRWLQTPTAARQVIFSTHSSDLLDVMTDGFREGSVQLIVASAAEGFRNVVPAELDSLFGEGWDLGDLYRMGEPTLGGWPW